MSSNIKNIKKGWYSPKTLALVTLISMGGALIGCFSKVELPPEKDYRVAQNQLAAEPTYNRTRWVHLASVIPAAHRRNSRDRAPLLMPVVNFDLDKGTLEEAASMLAASTHYSTYCSSLIAKKPISYKGVGTVDQIAKEISNRAHIRAVVDHNNREVRFTALEADDNRFSNNKVSEYEHRSDNP